MYRCHTPYRPKPAYLSGRTVPAGSGPYRCHGGSRWRVKNAMDSQAHSLPHGPLWSSLLCCARFPRDTPFFSPAGVLVGTVQHQRRFVHQILLNQGKKDFFPYTGFCSCAERYTLCHGPNRTGRSLHGTPVFSQDRIALSISRLPFPGRPPCGFLSGGNRSLVLFYCVSLISCRFVYYILPFCAFYTIPEF